MVRCCQGIGAVGVAGRCQGVGRVARVAQLCRTIPESRDWLLTSAWMSGDCEDTSKNAATDDEENSLRIFHDVDLWTCEECCVVGGSCQTG